MIVNEYKYGIIGMARKCDIVLHNGDHLNIKYVDPNGKAISLTVDTQHLVMLVAHEQSQAAMIIRPGGVQYNPPEV